MLHPRWNFSSRARDLSGGDAVVLSIPKSGRTWVRTFLSAYFSHTTARPFSIGITDSRAPGVPRIIYSHDWFEHRTKGNSWDRLRGKYLIPSGQVHRGPIALLARDPRDAFVSYFVQLTRRNPATVDAFKGTSPGDLIRDRRRGIGAMVETMNQWVKEFRGRAEFRIIRYEDLRSDPQEHFRCLLSGIGVSQPNSEALNHALTFSKFENMRQLEGTGAFGTKILQPRNLEDPESFKVRRGTVGGFREYLSADTQAYAARICATLDPIFAYPVENG